MLRSISRNFADIYFSPLEGSQKEGDNIQQLMKASNHSVNLYAQQQANETLDIKAVETAATGFAENFTNYAITSKADLESLFTNAGLVYEERPLTFPKPENKNRTIWKNHFFTKKDITEIKEISEKYFGHWI